MGYPLLVYVHCLENSEGLSSQLFPNTTQQETSVRYIHKFGEIQNLSIKKSVNKSCEHIA